MKEMDWRQLENFKGIELSDSYILSWQQSINKLSFELEASIWSESVFYETPKENEHTCYRKATLSFSDIISVAGLISMESTRYSTDPDGSIDYGNIDSLVITENGFSVVGDFGEVTIVGGVLNFEIHI